MKLKVNGLEMFLSKKFINVLKNVNHVISDRLLEMHISQQNDFKISFVDLASSVDGISFINSSKVPDYLDFDIVHGTYTRSVDVMDGQPVFKSGEFEYVEMFKNPWISDEMHVPEFFNGEFEKKEHKIWSANTRCITTIGKLIAKLFKDLPNSMTKDDIDKLEKPIDRQSFVEMYLAYRNATIKKFEIVNGKDINKWYLQDNYYKITGTLGNSCMRYEERNEYMNFYSDNLEKVRMIILFPENDRTKIIGRAILWKLDNCDHYFMDRIYTTVQEDEYLFLNFAKENGWLYKSRQSYGNHPINKPDGQTYSEPLSVTLLEKRYRSFPYLDTLSFFNSAKCVVTNIKPPHDDNSSYVSLTSQHGNGA